MSYTYINIVLTYNCWVGKKKKGGKIIKNIYIFSLVLTFFPDELLQTAFLSLTHVSTGIKFHSFFSNSDMFQPVLSLIFSVLLLLKGYFFLLCREQGISLCNLSVLSINS